MEGLSLLTKEQKVNGISRDKNEYLVTWVCSKLQGKPGRFTSSLVVEKILRLGFLTVPGQWSCLGLTDPVLGDAFETGCVEKGVSRREKMCSLFI